MVEETKDADAGNKTAHRPAGMSGIVLLLASLLSFISALIAVAFLSIGAWITSIPFGLATVFGIYFIYLQWSGEELGTED